MTIVFDSPRKKQDTNPLERQYFEQFSSYEIDDDPPCVGDIAELNGNCSGYCRIDHSIAPTALRPGERVKIVRLYIAHRSKDPFAEIQFDNGHTDFIPVTWIDVVERANGGVA